MVGWTSWALSRLTLTPAELSVLVRTGVGLPDTAAAAEVVDLHLSALDVSLDVGSPALFAPQLRWEATRWSQVTSAPCEESISEVLRSTLVDLLDEITFATVSRHAAEAEALATSAQRRLVLQRGASGLAGLSSPAASYLGLALEGDHEQAVALVQSLVARGVGVSQVLLDVLAPAQAQLGRLWEVGAIGVAQEHIATAVTQISMSALYPSLFAGERHDRTLVAAAVPGDHHELGLRIVTDLFQLHGWDTRYIGASCPVADVIDAVVVAEASMLLLGASMTVHLPALRTAVELVRADARCDGVAVMVGGLPFREDPALADWVGADLVAVTATEALELSEVFVSEREAAGV